MDAHRPHYDDERADGGPLLPPPLQHSGDADEGTRSGAVHHLDVARASAGAHGNADSSVAGLDEYFAVD